MEIPVWSEMVVLHLIWRFRILNGNFGSDIEIFDEIWKLRIRLSFSPRTHEHCSQEMYEVTGNFDGNLSKFSYIDKSLIISSKNMPKAIKYSQYLVIY